jgi:hypothetical protein
VERRRWIAAAREEEEGLGPLAQTIIDSDTRDFVEDMEELCEMPRAVAVELKTRAGKGFIGIDDRLDEQAAAMALTMTVQRARKKGGEVGTKMEQKALELREQELDGRCRVERQIELGRLRRYRDFLEREHCPLFLEHHGSFQAIDLRLDDDEDDDGDDDDVDDDEGQYDDGSDGESDESDGDDDCYNYDDPCGGGYHGREDYRYDGSDGESEEHGEDDDGKDGGDENVGDGDDDED